MNESVISGQRNKSQPWLTRLGRRLVLAQLEKLEHGKVTIIENGAETVFGKETALCPLSVRIAVNNPAMFADIAFGAGMGAGESYMAGHWETDNLSNVIRIFVNNAQFLSGVDSRLARLKSPIRRVLHKLNSNTIAGSKKNISAHYDLGNDFFKLFLDSSLMYSSAIFPDSEASLEQASFHKNETLCKKLRLTPGDHLVEIGTGWGGFAIHAASRFGCKVTTTTISKEQFNEAEKRVSAAGLQDQITLLNKDYRELEGQFDKLVSIEMIEAVGHQFLDTYIEKCSSLLEPHGLMALQAITIPARKYEYAVRNVDFIKRYIFPGGFLPSLNAISASVSRKTDLDTVHIEDLGLHYAATLKIWRERFLDRLPEVRKQGYSDEFIRMWEYYLCYSEGGFRERVISNSQIVFAKPGYRGPVFGSNEKIIA